MSIEIRNAPFWAPAYVFSIGLNVGASEPRGQLSRALHALNALGRVQDVTIGLGEWQGTKERTLQVLVSHLTLSPEQTAANLASYLEQDAIALLDADGQAWRLVDKAGAAVPGGTTKEFPITLQSV
jgi:hypothetical protein